MESVIITGSIIIISWGICSAIMAVELADKESKNTTQF